MTGTVGEKGKGGNLRPSPQHYRGRRLSASISRENMKVTEVDVWLVEGVKYNWTMLKIHTDTGHTGVGEATNWPGSPIVYEAAKHVGQRIIGMNPMNTDFIWTILVS